MRKDLLHKNNYPSSLSCDRSTQCYIIMAIEVKEHKLRCAITIVRNIMLTLDVNCV